VASSVDLEPRPTTLARACHYCSRLAGRNCPNSCDFGGHPRTCHKEMILSGRGRQFGLANTRSPPLGLAGSYGVPAGLTTAARETHSAGRLVSSPGRSSRGSVRGAGPSLEAMSEATASRGGRDRGSVRRPRRGGGSVARPSAAKSRCTAWGSVTAPTIRRGPPALTDEGPGWPTPGAGGWPRATARVTAPPPRPGLPASGRSSRAIGPAGRARPMVGAQRPARRRHDIVGVNDGKRIMEVAARNLHIKMAVPRTKRCLDHKMR
jgi:hypothetical protein